jgi:hypothetical protein
LHNNNDQIKKLTNLSVGVYYYCYEAVKAIFEKTKGNGKPMSTGESMLSGALAGCAVVLATHPIWTVNVSFCLNCVGKVGHLKLVII